MDYGVAMRSLSEVVDHIEQNLGGDLSLETLARRSGISPWHFHRRFRALVGEAPARHVRRLRLELAGVLLKHSDLPVTQIAFRVGYETHEAFTRAFGSRFGRAPSELRSRPSGVDTPCALRIVRLPARQIAFVRHVGPYAGATAGFDALLRWARARGLRPNAVLGVYLDDQDLTEPARWRCEVALVVPPSIQGAGAVRIRTLPAAEWAVFHHAGCVEERRRRYVDVYRSGIPSLGRQASSASPLERYACTRGGVEYGTAEVQIPLEPR